MESLCAPRIDFQNLIGYPLRFLRTIGVQSELSLAQKAISVRTVARHYWMQESGPHCRFQNRLDRACITKCQVGGQGEACRATIQARAGLFGNSMWHFFRYLPCFSRVFCVTSSHSLDAENCAKYVFHANGEVAEWLKAAVC